MSIPGNQHNGGANIARFGSGRFVGLAGGNRLVDAINNLIPPGNHGQVIDDRSPNPFRVYRISSSTQDFSNYRWAYSLMEQIKLGSGYDGWQDADDAESQDGFNFCEVTNGDDASPGNVLSGIEMDANTANGVKAIPNNTLVLGYAVPTQDDSGNDILEVWFFSQNDLAVDCASGS